MYMDEDVFNKYESNVRSYCRSYPAIFNEAKGSYLFDVDGKKYIDLLSGAGALNYGHNQPNMTEALLEYINGNGVMMGLDVHSLAKKKFIQAFQTHVLAPRALDYKIQFTSPTGTSVVESAVKLARKFTGRQNVVAFTNAFHGMTGVSLSLTGSKHHRQMFNQGNVTRLPFEGYLGEHVDTINYFEKLLNDQSSGLDHPAAVILETVQAEGGLNVASVSWLQRLSRLCSRFNMLLIIDDIQAGCGRSGRFLSFERAGIQPDIVCLSKSLSGLGLPLAILLFSPELDVWLAGEDNGTFRGNNLAFVSATTALETFWANNDFAQEIQRKATTIERFIDQLVNQFPALILRRKGIGMMQGAEFHDADKAEQVKQHCYQSGLIIETCGNQDQILKFMPALNIPDSVLAEAMAIIQQALMTESAVAQWLDKPKQVVS